MNTRGAAVLEGEQAEAFLRERGQVRGMVLRSEAGGKVSLVPWKKAARVPVRGSRGPERWNPRVMVQNVPVPEAAKQQMLAGLPAERRRESRERYHALVTRLIAEALKYKEQYGKVLYPASVMEEIKRLAWLEGDPTLPERIQRGSTDAIEKYAGYLMNKAAHQQRDKDRKLSTRDWHGHYNDTITVGGLAANVKRPRQDTEPVTSTAPTGGVEPRKE